MGRETDRIVEEGTDRVERGNLLKGVKCCC